MITSYIPGALVLKEPNDTVKHASTKNQSANETLLGIAGSDRVLLFEYADFDDGIKVYNATFSSRFFSNKMVVAGSSEDRFMLAWENPDYPQVEFTAVQDEYPIIMEDNLGNRYNLLGRAESGPDVGKQLPATRAYRALEFAWASMFETLIYFSEQ